ncbi:hypothetical protein niasHT_035542 [Heterodera trifolii]|uniref:Uncharacterized protein n=1 Tax=Heterodera trifolii TaxID=157864 RepID=A0ABD2I1F8_9BILA
MGKRNLPRKLNCKKALKEREKKREERKAQTAKAIQARLAKKNAPQPNPDAETPQQDEAGPSTSAASAGEAMEPPPPTPGPVPTPEMDEELLEFGFSLPSTPATPIGDLVPFPSTPIAPMDIGEMTPPPLVIDDRSERIEQLEKELKDRDDTIKFHQLYLVIDRSLRTIDQTVELAEQYRAALQNGDKATAAVRSASMGITKPPLLRSINFDRIIHAPFHVFQGIGNAIVRELERQEGCAPIAQQFFRRIGARREQFRKRDLTGNSIRKILVRATEMAELFTMEWPKAICRTLEHLGKIQNFSKAQILSPNDLDGLERSIDDFKVFLAEQDRMSAFLSKKPKAHLLLFHFVPFARQHQFIGLLDEQGDEALHSVWRRLEQWWKCMPDAEQILQQLEHHFVNNCLLDTGRIDELKRNYEERKGEDDTDDEATEEIDDECQIDASEEKRCLAAELTLAYHCARHNFSMSSANCSSDLFGVVFSADPAAIEFASKRYKTTALIRGVLSPHFGRPVQQEKRG